MELTVGDHSPRHVRRIVRTYLRTWGMADVRDAVELAVSELLTNVHRHVADRWCRVTVVKLHQGVRVEVHDREAAHPVAREAGAEDETGRGLAIVALVTDRHGVTPGAEGKTVWFECGKGVRGVVG
ncbi:ATP-binding protein [Streptomyces sp. JJ66]|nr:ATP-binding protein [Streptomyces sp. JJ66]